MQYCDDIRAAGTASEKHFNWQNRASSALIRFVIQ